MIHIHTAGVSVQTRLMKGTHMNTYALAAGSDAQHPNLTTQTHHSTIST